MIGINNIFSTDPLVTYQEYFDNCVNSNPKIEKFVKLLISYLLMSNRINVNINIYGKSITFSREHHNREFYFNTISRVFLPDDKCQYEDINNSRNTYRMGFYNSGDFYINYIKNLLNPILQITDDEFILYLETEFEKVLLI